MIHPPPGNTAPPPLAARASHESFPATVLLLKAERFLLALPVAKLDCVGDVSEIHPLTGAPAAIQGLMYSRGKPLVAYDMRVLLGSRPAADEVNDFCTMLAARKEDHIRWLEELEHSTVQKRPFSLVTDPTQCAFGRWYAQFCLEFHSQSEAVKHLLDHLDAPHRRIHALAEQIETDKQGGHFDRALQRIEHAEREDLMLLKELFDQLVEAYRRASRQSFAVVQAGETRVALIVDEVLGVEQITLENIIPDANSGFLEPPSLFVGMGRRAPAHDSAFVLAIEVDRLSRCHGQASTI